MDKTIFYSMSYGVYIVSALDGSRPTGCVANSIMQITSDPATVAVSINHDNYTNQCIARTKKFSFSILSENTDPSLIGTFGFQSGRDNDKFQEVSYEIAEGIPVIKDACGYVVCEVINTMETDTHTVFLGKVTEAKTYEGKRPAMTYAYYHNVIKGKSPKNAPTYQPEESVQEDQKSFGKYVCQICGYVYEGDELPAEYSCPVCGQGADKFKRAKE